MARLEGTVTHTITNRNPLETRLNRAKPETGDHWETRSTPGLRARSVRVRVDRIGMTYVFSLNTLKIYSYFL